MAVDAPQPHTAPDGAPRTQARRAAGASALLRRLTIASLLTGGGALLLGFASGTPAVLVEGAFAVGLAGWLWWVSRPDSEAEPSSWMGPFAVAVLVLVCLATVLTPEVSHAAPLGAVLAVVLALPFVEDRVLRRLMVAAFAVTVFVSGVAATGWLAPTLPPAFQAPLDLLGIVMGTASLLVLLAYHRGQLSSSTREMDRMMTLSRDLSRTLDPLQVGQRLARHLTEATGAQDCTISSYDPVAGRVITFASYPPERAQMFDDSYELDGFPLTRQVLEEREVVSVHVADPGADEAEAAILRDEGRTALLMVPLVAHGETIGLVELTRDGDRFDEGAEALAWSVSSEAAMALDNARLYEELRHQAFHDALTRLPNRALFNDRLRHALARGERRGNGLAVLFIDIDAFKAVNDRLGHERGDQLLRAVADRLRTCVRESDTAARMGGDEFAVILEDLASPFEAEVVSRRILSAMAAPVRLGDTETTVSVSIGVCHTGREGETAETLVRDADFAMYRAKSLGKGRAEVFRTSLRAAAARRDETERQLRTAIERGDLRLRWQPIIALDTGRVAGVEALVRWRSPDGRLRRPLDFIPLAEETGLIVPIGRWVLREACAGVQRLRGVLGREDLSVAVNLSARQFQGPSLQDDVSGALAASRLPAGALTLELTESVLMKHTPTTVATLEALRQGGVRVAVDDFGTGYSSLAYLQRFPVDVLKIDRTFVERAGTAEGSVLARAVVELGRALGLQVVAEGIEDIGQLQAMRAYGCGYGQGYLFATPLGADDLQRLLVDGPRSWEVHWGRSASGSEARARTDAVAAPVAIVHASLGDPVGGRLLAEP